MSLILVANRAPIRPVDGGWAPSLGGLASALLPVLEARGGAWVAMREPDDDAPLDQAWPAENPTFGVRRVPLSEDEFEAFYQGMSNRVLWPLSHYLVQHVEPERAFLQAYLAVNDRFAQAAVEVADESGERPTFWVQDYHMMRVPKRIREARPDARIGFFWHVPWPASEVFQILPSARPLLRGVLGSDLIGFHTEGYAENFRESARDLLGAEIDGTDVLWAGRRCRVEAHPIGIDVGRFEALATDPETVARAETLRAEFGDIQLVLGVDRLDYTKGLLLRMEAFERFLEQFPERHGTVSLLQIATPSRGGVEAYDQLKRSLDEAAGRINGRFAQGAWAPLRYRHQSFDHAELAALYQIADVGLVTPLRDGMNLVAHEYAAVSAVAAAGGGRPGALVLSELTGAADYLDGALLVNPYDTDGLSQTLADALDLPRDDRADRLSRMREAVGRLDVHVWAKGFLESLDAG